MTKTIYLLDIGDYVPKVKALTMPFIRIYAKRIGAEIVTITERKFPAWPVTYEKLQIYDLARQNPADWHIYLDVDTLIHPQCPDYTLYVPRNGIAFYSADRSHERFAVDGYFERDARFLAPGNWLMIASSNCLDLWRPLDDMTPEEAIRRITPTAAEVKWGLKPEHLVDDFALARNIARFGLSVKLIVDINREHGLTKKEDEGFLQHRYLATEDEKAAMLNEQIDKWDIRHYLEGQV